MAETEPATAPRTAGRRGDLRCWMRNGVRRAGGVGMREYAAGLERVLARRRGVRPRVVRILDRCGAVFAPQRDVLPRV